MARTARLYGISFRLPEPFPFGSVAAARVFYWLDQRDSAAALAFAKAVYARAFVEGKAVSTAEETAEVASGLGHDRTDTLAALQSPELKQRLKSMNDEAIAKGVFGSPYLSSMASRSGAMTAWTSSIAGSQAAAGPIGAARSSVRLRNSKFDLARADRYRGPRGRASHPTPLRAVWDPSALPIGHRKAAFAEDRDARHLFASNVSARQSAGAWACPAPNGGFAIKNGRNA